MAIEPTGRRVARSVTGFDPLAQNSGGSSLEMLTRQPSALDRLVADAGALGKFREDQPNALPSGTGSFTVPVTQTIAHVETRLGQPNERVLGATQASTPREIVPAARSSEVTHLGLHTADDRTHGVTPRPDVRTDTDNRAAAFMRGNRSASEA
ncbi:hypothetical protein HZF05_08725 [Sphingomonas sp. CGMCC 1.13654]|uniref:Uncharacterized protein n=1 Tax=Sphingomonas chungangi TaxID=2683589 RepID=A0A838L3W1_9SPHN|nr:hypothetical protein [Sphingomonas chungangi]MBA2934183.1 hypothetical protein [Sphingomonas chungangi]MVW57224.1 hypothetical protein [Sphingomonas chungangi]